MLVTTKGCWDIFLHVNDMPIGNQHNYMPKCDVGDRFVMLGTFFNLMTLNVNVGANFQIELVQWS